MISVTELIERTQAYVPDAKPGDLEFMAEFAKLVTAECEAEIVSWIGYSGAEQDEGLQKAASIINTAIDL